MRAAEFRPLRRRLWCRGVSLIGCDNRADDGDNTGQPDLEFFEVGSFGLAEFVIHFRDSPLDLCLAADNAVEPVTDLVHTLIQRELLIASVAAVDQVFAV